MGTYAYVNPVIAVLLGWLLLREPITTRTLAAMTLTLGAVVWIQVSQRLALGRRGAPAVRRTPPSGGPPVRQSAL